MTDKSQIPYINIVIGTGVGVVVVLIVLLCAYCLRRRLIARNILRETQSFTLSREQHKMYQQKLSKKRYSRVKQLQKLRTVPKTKNPLVYDELRSPVTGPSAGSYDTALATPGPASKHPEDEPDV